MLKVRTNWPLRNGFGFISTARHLLTITADADIPDAVAFAHATRRPLLVIGEGSNLITPPRKDDACILKIATTSWRLTDDTTNTVTVCVDAGHQWHNLVQQMLQYGYHGLENLAGIPGTVGAAPVQNIGAYGVELSEYVTLVDCYSLTTKRFVTLNRNECAFTYRSSRFKRTRDMLILRVYLTLNKTFSPRLTHPKLANLKLNVSASTLFDAVLAVRAHSIPSDGSVGSFFINPVITTEQHRQLKQQHSQLLSKPLPNNQYQLKAGWLIEQAGWKGYKHQDYGVDANNALVLVNYTPYTDKVVANDIVTLASMIQQSVRHRFGIVLEQEPSTW